MWRNGWEAVRSVDGIAKMRSQLAIPSIEHTDRSTSNQWLELRRSTIIS